MTVFLKKAILFFGVVASASVLSRCAIDSDMELISDNQFVYTNSITMHSIKPSRSSLFLFAGYNLAHYQQNVFDWLSVNSLAENEGLIDVSHTYLNRRCPNFPGRFLFPTNPLFLRDYAEVYPDEFIYSYKWFSHLNNRLTHYK